MTCYLIAGEASGDLHGSNLMKAIRAKEPKVSFRGFGGDLMTKEGLEVVKHIDELAFMGFAEVIMNIRTILRNIRLCKDDIASTSPDMLILVDYPGFNLRMAKYARGLGIPVYYYISPQIWAWKSQRVHRIARDTDRVFCILPFEKEFYARYGYEVDYVGHPLLDALDLPPLNGDRTTQQRIALLPGSRAQEVSIMLPIMLEAMRRFPDHRFAIAKAPGLNEDFYARFLDDDVELFHGGTSALLQRSDAALVTSGTATLETALIGIPQVVCYKGNWLSYHIARRIVKIEYISLVNLIMDKSVVRELIQSELHASAIEQELSELLEPGSEKRRRMMEEYARLREVLGGPGASARCASELLKIQQAMH